MVLFGQKLRMVGNVKNAGFSLHPYSIRHTPTYLKVICIVHVYVVEIDPDWLKTYEW